jgi:hypothetical protein
MSLSRFPLVEKRRSEQPGAPMEMRYGKIDLESEATNLYETECELLFAAARKRSPTTITRSRLDALDYIIEVLESAFAEATDEQ